MRGKNPPRKKKNGLKNLPGCLGTCWEKKRRKGEQKKARRNVPKSTKRKTSGVVKTPEFISGGPTVPEIGRKRKGPEKKSEGQLWGKKWGSSVEE